jgi:excisionase family DNA binding protein
MDQNNNGRDYLDVAELAERTGLSRATIWRLKRKRLIPFFQPGGKGTTVVFPKDAIEKVNDGLKPENSDADVGKGDRLPGPQPAWMSPSRQSNQ